MKERDQRIIDAVLRKAEALCSGSLELLGVYGSAVTGDDYERSDVDLLIVADAEGRRLLTCAFILEDSGVGYDLYRTSWESLEEDADCAHAHLSKLMDARIVYCRDGAAAARLEGLRKKAADILSSDARFDKAQALFAKAVPDYDPDRFYVSHMKKVVDWYNELCAYASLDFEEDEEAPEE